MDAAGGQWRARNAVRLAPDHARLESPDVSVEQSKAMRELMAGVDKIAEASDTTVMIEGEPGSGKTWLARHIHWKTPVRSAYPFIAVPCGHLPEPELEEEIVGVEDGASGGALRRGALEMGDRGTVLLDEVDQIGTRVQRRVLDVLEGRGCKRLGGTREISPHVRIIASTCQDLSRWREMGAFEGRLYGRLSSFHLRLPPLRDRQEDIVPLASRFVTELGCSTGRPGLHLAPDAERTLIEYDFPGNVRELKILVQEACLRTETDEIGAECLVFQRHAQPNESPFFWVVLDGEGRPPALQVIKQGYMARVLKHTMGNRSEAAKLLNVSLPTVPKRSTVEV
jgi:DNA-binding NtrC family response regulator